MYSVLKKKKRGCSRKDLQKSKVLSLEWKSEWVMEKKTNNNKYDC